MATTMDELRHAGLLDNGQPHLTDKGRDWLRALENLKRSEAASERAPADEFLYLPDAASPESSMGDDEDFVCSTSGLLR